MKVKIVGMAECRYCHRAIEWQDWGNGGRIWKHSDDRVNCSEPTRATPPIDWEPSQPEPVDASQATDKQAEASAQSSPVEPCEWCGRAVRQDDAGRWFAVKGAERGYDPLACDASDDGTHNPPAKGPSTP